MRKVIIKQPAYYGGGIDHLIVYDDVDLNGEYKKYKKLSNAEHLKYCNFAHYLILNNKAILDNDFEEFEDKFLFGIGEV